MLVGALFALIYFAFEPSRDEVASAISPDGRLVARLVEVNGGATTSFGYRVTISEAATKSKSYEVASLYGAVRNDSAFGANLNWTSSQQLTIEYLKADSSQLLNPKLELANTEVAVVLRPNVIDPTAPAGGMLYNLRGRRR
jgi:hypothetical protein